MIAANFFTKHMIIKERIFVSFSLFTKVSFFCRSTHVVPFYMMGTNQLAYFTYLSFDFRSQESSLFAWKPKNSENLSGSKYPHCTLIFLETKHSFLPALFAPKQATGCQRLLCQKLDFKVQLSEQVEILSHLCGKMVKTNALFKADNELSSKFIQQFIQFI